MVDSPPPFLHFAESMCPETSSIQSRRSLRLPSSQVEPVAFQEDQPYSRPSASSRNSPLKTDAFLCCFVVGSGAVKADFKLPISEKNR